LNLLTNPVFLRLALVFVLAAMLFVLGVWLMRKVRQALTEEDNSAARPRADTPQFPLAAYDAVIRQLKEQEQELQRLRRAASERAAASENISAAILSNLTSGVVLFNPAGLVQQANLAARDLLGYASVSGLHARDLFRGARALRVDTGEAPASLAHAVESCLRQGVVFRRIEADYATPAGTPRVLGVTISPVAGAAGEKLGATCFIADLTEITELARQVRLRENLAALGEMSAGIAHEFKNSLATISGYAQMLGGENDLPTAREFAGKIRSETAALTRIVTDFLNFARPQALMRDAVDIPALLDSCARECHVELEVKELPAEFRDGIVGDFTALRQAFSNLLRNSAEAARNGTVRVEVSGAIEGEQARLTFRDNAGGIPADVVPHVFIPFFTTKEGGTGLGLALVHRIVTEHGGSVAVAAAEGGTAFTLSFPRARREEKDPESG
jgi:PAS domain S-box-containing protein